MRSTAAGKRPKKVRRPSTTRMATKERRTLMTARTWRMKMSKSATQEILTNNKLNRPSSTGLKNSGPPRGKLVAWASEGLMFMCFIYVYLLLLSIDSWFIYKDLINLKW